MSSSSALLNAVFRLEGERTLAICALGQDDNSRVGLEAVNAELDAAMAALNANGLRYPLHMLASASDLTQGDYLLLQLAALVRLDEALVSEATGYLGGASPFMRVSHVTTLFRRLEILGPDELLADDAFKVLAERLVIRVLVDDGRGDDAVATGPAVDELMGW